ncbi:hypothetical protein F6X40_40675 [Paraburkholderia sp. UCT31]|uniref:hypothetical protein n=1 Tax=Paraburkholderia sp. UCT31 TaxID=2615209 RepID=UPI00165569F8|nr:hypothetical protein [Paraburkholderia sp. UCT31]MBC8742790.1 hypothetical protein [Paraburkholderia sp. UCT31]
MMTASVLALALAPVLRALYLRRQLRGTTLVRRDRKGALSYEVRRRVCMEALPLHVSEYPVPREVRLRVLRLASLVLWSMERSIALPSEACARLGNISAQEFDDHFPNWLQLGQPEAGSAMFGRRPLWALEGKRISVKGQAW